ncbi:class I SAM-dependent methyltransferase, partial [Acholeplasma sp. OttesenSCG-928-E16]|nr:class I SAM-dependent methyltransferase [Acholeplasma sp. OttesenSCG-928-E16]
MNKKIEELKTKARALHVPIITDDGLAFLLDLIKKKKAKRILEIGAAVGYSTINMALLTEKIDTFERDPGMLEKLYDNISQFDLKDKINVFPYDALDYEEKMDTYDLIFIDAAKAQYQKFFLKYAKYLKKDGVIVCDNLNFHNLNPNEVSRQTRQLLRKIESF